MITVMVAENEEKIKEILRQGESIKIIRQDELKHLVSLADKIIELEESLFRDNRGTLYKAIIERIEKPLLEHILERTEGNQLKAAKILGINRNTMRSKINKLGINAEKWKVTP
jgi:two-component system nitrogen regulation response regulator GlnG